MKSQSEPAKGEHRKRLTLVLLGIAAIVVAATIFILVRGPARHEQAEPVRQSDEERVLAASAKLLAAAEGLSEEARQAGYKQARELLEAYIRGRDDDYRVRIRLAEMLAQAGQRDQAEHTVDDAIRRHPNAADALWLKGQLVRTRGVDTHMKYFRLAATSPEATPAIWGKYGIELALLGQSAEAQTYLQRAIDGGATDLDVMCQLARIMIAQGRCAGANDLLMSAVRQPQAGWRAWKLLADAQRRLERPDDAAASVQQALSMLPKPYPPELAMDAAELLMSLGQLRLAAKRDTEAAEVFAVAANDYTPMRGEAAFEAAKCYHRLGRFAVAMRFIDIAAKLLPADDSVKQWVRTIEDSRFGPAGAGAAASAPAAPTATAPAGGTAPSVGR